MGGDGVSARPDVFVGRLPELAALAAALSAVRAGEPKVVVLQGEAGIGKSSLVRDFLARHQQCIPIVTASCDEAEAFLPYGVIQQLVAQATAVSPDALAGLELLSSHPPSVDADPLAVGAELLALISSLDGNDAARRGSEAVAVVIEDLQWIDLASARTLLFACRRLSLDRVLVVLTCRSGGMSQLGEGWERFVSSDRRAIRLTLRGLDIEELGMMCEAVGRDGLPDRALRRMLAATDGNPLLIRTLLAEQSDEALKAQNAPLGAPRSLAELMRHRLAALSPATRDFVAAAAVLGEHSTIADIAGVSRVSGPAAALDEAERQGFLLEKETSTGWQVSFRHPLVRQAVYSDLTPEFRRTLHRRAAATIAADGSLSHRAAAAVGPDLELASDLDKAAETAVVAGNLRLAARYLHQAATVSEGGPARDDRTLSSFELLVRAADVGLAEAARPAVERLPASARANAALGQLALLAARPLEARTLLREAWDAHDPVADGTTGREAAIGLGILLGISGSFIESGIWLDRALENATGSEPWHDTARSMRAIPLTLSGQGDKALSLFTGLPERAAMVPMANTDSLTYRGLVKLWTSDLQGATDDLAVAANRIRTGLQVRFPGQPLVFLAEAEFRRGRWDDCQDHAELAVSLARDADRHYDLPFVHSAAATVPACRGDWEVATRHVESAEDAARAFGGCAEILAASARGILGFARNDPAEALRGATMAMAVPEIDYYDDPGAFWWRPLQIWALVRNGRLDEAATTLAAFERRATDRGESLALINAAWLHGLLAMAHGGFEQADHLLKDGCNAADAGPFPFQRGVLHLEHGRCLARLQKRKAAISALRAADHTFTRLAARPFADATASELTALGVRPRAGGDPDLPGLTRQELRVARLVVSGFSNREAAAQLYLSPKTVEYHLASVFTKLGISSRHQLAARIAGREAP